MEVREEFTLIKKEFKKFKKHKTKSIKFESLIQQIINLNGEIYCILKQTQNYEKELDSSLQKIWKIRYIELTKGGFCGDGNFVTAKNQFLSLKFDSKSFKELSEKLNLFHNILFTEQTLLASNVKITYLELFNSFEKKIVKIKKKILKHTTTSIRITPKTKTRLKNKTDNNEKEKCKEETKKVKDEKKPETETKTKEKEEEEEKKNEQVELEKEKDREKKKPVSKIKFQEKNINKSEGALKEINSLLLICFKYIKIIDNQKVITLQDVVLIQFLQICIKTLFKLSHNSADLSLLQVIIFHKYKKIRRISSWYYQITSKFRFNNSLKEVWQTVYLIQGLIRRIEINKSNNLNKTNLDQILKDSDYEYLFQLLPYEQNINYIISYFENTFKKNNEIHIEFLIKICKFLTDSFLKVIGNVSIVPMFSKNSIICIIYLVKELNILKMRLLNEKNSKMVIKNLILLIDQILIKTISKIVSLKITSTNIHLCYLIEIPFEILSNKSTWNCFLILILGDLFEKNKSQLSTITSSLDWDSLIIKSKIEDDENNYEDDDYDYDYNIEEEDDDDVKSYMEKDEKKKIVNIREVIYKKFNNSIEKSVYLLHSLSTLACKKEIEIASCILKELFYLSFIQLNNNNDNDNKNKSNNGSINKSKSILVEHLQKTNLGLIISICKIHTNLCSQIFFLINTHFNELSEEIPYLFFQNEIINNWKICKRDSVIICNIFEKENPNSKKLKFLIWLLKKLEFSILNHSKNSNKNKNKNGNENENVNGNENENGNGNGNQIQNKHEQGEEEKILLKSKQLIYIPVYFQRNWIYSIANLWNRVKKDRKIKDDLKKWICSNCWKLIFSIKVFNILGEPLLPLTQFKEILHEKNYYSQDLNIHKNDPFINFLIFLTTDLINEDYDNKYFQKIIQSLILNEELFPLTLLLFYYIPNYLKIIFNKYLTKMNYKFEKNDYNNIYSMNDNDENNEERGKNKEGKEVKEGKEKEKEKEKENENEKEKEKEKPKEKQKEKQKEKKKEKKRKRKRKRNRIKKNEKNITKIAEISNNIEKKKIMTLNSIQNIVNKYFNSGTNTNNIRNNNNENNSSWNNKLNEKRFKSQDANKLQKLKYKLKFYEKTTSFYHNSIALLALHDSEGINQLNIPILKKIKKDNILKFSLKEIMNPNNMKKKYLFYELIGKNLLITSIFNSSLYPFMFFHKFINTDTKKTTFNTNNNNTTFNHYHKNNNHNNSNSLFKKNLIINELFNNNNNNNNYQNQNNNDLKNNNNHYNNNMNDATNVNNLISINFNEKINLAKFLFKPISFNTKTFNLNYLELKMKNILLVIKEESNKYFRKIEMMKELDQVYLNQIPYLFYKHPIKKKIVTNCSKKTKCKNGFIAVIEVEQPKRNEHNYLVLKKNRKEYKNIIQMQKEIIDNYPKKISISLLNLKLFLKKFPNFIKNTQNIDLKRPLVKFGIDWLEILLNFFNNENIMTCPPTCDLINTFFPNYVNYFFDTTCHFKNLMIVLGMLLKHPIQIPLLMKNLKLNELLINYKKDQIIQLFEKLSHYYLINPHFNYDLILNQLNIFQLLDSIRDEIKENSYESMYDSNWNYNSKNKKYNPEDITHKNINNLNNKEIDEKENNIYDGIVRNSNIGDNKINNNTNFNNKYKNDNSIQKHNIDLKENNEIKINDYELNNNIIFLKLLKLIFKNLSVDNFNNCSFFFNYNYQLIEKFINTNFEKNFLLMIDNLLNFTFYHNIHPSVWNIFLKPYKLKTNKVLKSFIDLWRESFYNYRKSIYPKLLIEKINPYLENLINFLNNFLKNHLNLDKNNLPIHYYFKLLKPLLVKFANNDGVIISSYKNKKSHLQTIIQLNRIFTENLLLKNEIKGITSLINFWFRLNFKNLLGNGLNLFFFIYENFFTLNKNFYLNFFKIFIQDHLLESNINKDFTIISNNNNNDDNNNNIDDNDYKKNDKYADNDSTSNYDNNILSNDDYKNEKYFKIKFFLEFLLKINWTNLQNNLFKPSEKNSVVESLFQILLNCIMYFPLNNKLISKIIINKIPGIILNINWNYLSTEKYELILNNILLKYQNKNLKYNLQSVSTKNNDDDIENENILKINFNHEMVDNYDRILFLFNFLLKISNFSQNNEKIKIFREFSIKLIFFYQNHENEIEQTKWKKILKDISFCKIEK
ncbi:eukaryotic translation initiation factor 4 gamma [Anaeramoeba flamelloides]|uniref:Eukaryotic translation initiation factor 4 gamma n=1 Tax=Anaeramoeba flamelloides TaxID=1746091 RepID=A0ABQ8X592_9EUKA|nr:eukaryotic translation initiation factor 4 gamma [Anaeramoeba flamelloides]